MLCGSSIIYSLCWLRWQVDGMNVMRMASWDFSKEFTIMLGQARRTRELPPGARAQWGVGYNRGKGMCSGLPWWGKRVWSGESKGLRRKAKGPANWREKAKKRRGHRSEISGREGRGRGGFCRECRVPGACLRLEWGKGGSVLSALHVTFIHDIGIVSLPIL